MEEWLITMVMFTQYSKTMIRRMKNLLINALVWLIVSLVYRDWMDTEETDKDWIDMR